MHDRRVVRTALLRLRPMISESGRVGRGGGAHVAAARPWASGSAGRKHRAFGLDLVGLFVHFADVRRTTRARGIPLLAVQRQVEPLALVVFPDPEADGCVDDLENAERDDQGVEARRQHGDGLRPELRRVAGQKTIVARFVENFFGKDAGEKRTHEAAHKGFYAAYAREVAEGMHRWQRRLARAIIVNTYAPVGAGAKEHAKGSVEQCRTAPS